MTHPTLRFFIAAALSFAAACGSGGDSDFQPTGDGDGDGDIDPLSCNDDGAFLAVDFSGALTHSIAPDDSIRCVSVGEPDGLIRGVALTHAIGDRQWTVDISGDVELGQTGEGIPVEIYVFYEEGEALDSWFGDCLLDLEVFEPSDSDLDTYLFGGAVTCDASLEAFVPGDNDPVDVGNLEFLGLIFN